MKEIAPKPWSQVDDEFDEAVVNPACDPKENAAVQKKDGGSASTLAAGLFGAIGRFTQPGGIPHWPLIPMVVAVGWLVFGMVFTSAAEGGILRWHALGILALIIASAVLTVRMETARRQAVAQLMNSVQGAVGGVSEASLSGPVSPEFRSIWQGLERHTANVEKQVNELLRARQQLSMELTLAEGQSRQAAGILNGISDPILITDSFDRLVQSNTAAEELFGFSAEKMRRQPIDKFVSDKALLDVMAQAREADTRSAGRHARHSFGKKTYTSTVTPLVGDGSQDGGEETNHGVAVLLRDVTREQEASKKKSEFVSHVAHELRTPLSSICAYVEMLVDGEAEEEATRQEFYEIIQSSADRLGRLIDNMLDISRIEAGTVRINKERISLAMVTREAIDVMRPKAVEKNIDFTEDLTPVAYSVMADRDLIYQAVLNLIGNAIKYTPQGGKVCVRITPHEENQTILIEVCDTGVGIPKEDLPRMFGKFFRVEANMKMAKGTGLGLNLVKNIVETIHEGTVALTSEVGKGSTFGISLPLMS